MTDMFVTKQKIKNNRKIPMTGLKFGRLTVVEEAGRSNGGFVLWKCVCDCGNEKVINGASLRQGISRSCGCLKKDTDKNKMLHDYTGERIGRLKVLKQTEPISTNGNKKHRRWHVKCDCGVEKTLQTQTLRKQKETGFGSCGCWSKERNRQKRLKHTKPYSFYLNRIRNSVNNRNKKRKNNLIKVDINYTDLISLIPKDGSGFCHYCGEPIFWDKHEEPKNSPKRRSGHNFDRKDNSKGYEVNNIIPCCGSCNKTRGDRFTYEEFMLIAPILKTIRMNRGKESQNANKRRRKTRDN